MKKQGVLKSFVIGWFVLQCWLTALVAIGATILLIGIFGDDRAAQTLRLLQEVTGLPWLFPNAIIASTVLILAAVASFVVKAFVERVLFQIIILTALAFVCVWVALNVLPRIG